MLTDVKVKNNLFSKNNLSKTIIYIPIKSIRTNPYQPRRVFNQDLLVELSNSIKQYGVLQPISVRRIDDKNYELVAGERRLKACQMAGLTRIPAMLCELKNQDSAVVALVENIQRCDLTYLEEAEAYNKLLIEHGLTQAQLAIKVGKTQSTVANKVRLLKLPTLVRDIIKDNNLTERHARALLRLDNADMQMQALNVILERNYNVNDTDILVDKMLEEKLKKELNKDKPEKEKMPQNNTPTNETADKQQKSVNKRRNLKNICIFTKAISKTMSALKDKGINAESDQKEFDEYYEYSIKIYK